MRADVVVEDPGHLRVGPRHEPLGPLHHSGLQTPCPERLGQLQPDVAAADDDGARGAPLQVSDDVVHVRDVAQDVDPGVVRTRDRRPDRFGAGAQHQLVVGLPVGPSLLLVADLDLLGLPVDADHLLPGPYVERKALGEALRRLQKEALAVRDLPADVVGQAAVRERHIVVPLEDDDLGRLVEPPQPGPGRRTCRDSSDDHCLHRSSISSARRSALHTSLPRPGPTAHVTRRR